MPRFSFYSINKGLIPPDGYKSRLAKLRRQRVKDTNNTCEICNISVNKRCTSEFHHLHYGTLWYENPEDMQLLCQKCHHVAHKERNFFQWSFASPEGLTEWLKTLPCQELIKKFPKYWQDRVLTKKSIISPWPPGIPSPS